MKYIGISNDEKYVFMNEGFYYLENGKNKFVKYNSKFITHLSEIYKSNVEFEYNASKITLQEKLLSSKKFLNLIYESFDISKRVKSLLMLEWDKNFESVYLVNENTNSLLVEETYNDSWNYVGYLLEGWLDDTWQGTKNIASKAWEGTKKLASGALDVVKKGLNFAAQKIIIPIIKQGVIPLLRWIRRNLNTYFGIIADIILSLLPTVVVMKVVWGLICLLDIYEIATGDYDPNDPERKEMPFIFFIGDLISWIFAAAAGKGAALSLKAGVKSLSKSPAAKKVLTTMLEKAPGISKMFGSVKTFLTKLFGPSAAGIIGKLFGFVDTVVSKLIIWIRGLLGITTKKAVKKLVPKVVVGAGLGVGVAEFFKEKTVKEGDKGNKVKEIQKGLLMVKSTPTSQGGLPSLQYNGPVNGVYGPEMTKAVKQLQSYYKFPVTGSVDPKLAFVFGIESEPGNLDKIVGTDNMKAFGQKILDSNKWLESKFGKFKGSTPNK